jgi:hypothetical protein
LGKLQQEAVAAFFGAVAMPLELDVNPLGEDPNEAVQKTVCGLELAGVQKAGQETFRTSRQEVKVLAVGGDFWPGSRRIPFRFPTRCEGQEAAEVAITGAGGSQQHQPRPLSVPCRSLPPRHPLRGAA